jgi:NADH:ubiquinone oxidoreductase subunit 6 (subunit J)
MIRTILPATAILTLIVGAVLYFALGMETLGLFILIVGFVAVIVTTLALSIGRVYERVPKEKTYGG